MRKIKGIFKKIYEDFLFWPPCDGRARSTIEYPSPLEAVRVKLRYQYRQRNGYCPLRSSDGRCAHEPKYPGKDIAHRLRDAQVRTQGMCTACWLNGDEYSPTKLPVVWFSWEQETKFAVPRAQAQELERRRLKQIEQHSDQFADALAKIGVAWGFRWETEGEVRYWYPPECEYFLLREQHWIDLSKQEKQ